MLAATLQGPVNGVIDDISKVGSQIQSVLQSSGKALEAAQAILEDQYFPRIVDLIKQLKALEGPKTPTASTPATAATAAKPVGVGLHRFVKPLEMYVEYRKRPWIGYVAVATAVAIPLLLGFGIGRLTKRSCPKSQ
jgi:hypothetical protein